MSGGMSQSGFSCQKEGTIRHPIKISSQRGSLRKRNRLTSLGCRSQPDKKRKNGKPIRITTLVASGGIRFSSPGIPRSLNQLSRTSFSGLYDKQTLGLGGLILQWTGIEQWLQTVMVQTEKPGITYEYATRRATQYAKAVEKLVAAKVRNGGAHKALQSTRTWWRGVAKCIFALMKELEQYARNRRHPLPS